MTITPRLAQTCLIQGDIKCLIAYSSVVHIGMRLIELCLMESSDKKVVVMCTKVTRLSM
ncbi:proton-conducting transporter transmembrane domain-containing protein [Klebsiella pneumoniae]|uniref:proton-conducting transporter transmembrane domain-containing protein n=1 Tax=Klebsiella pneumoniae TaxID=573 RepID=UPI00163D3D6B